LANISAQATNAAVRVTDRGDLQLAGHQVAISPHGTKMPDLNETKFATTTTGGVYLTNDGPSIPWPSARVGRGARKKRSILSCVFYSHALLEFARLTPSFFNRTAPLIGGFFKLLQK
jgi:hypothetical protein